MLRFVKRDEITRSKSIIIRIIAVILALLVSSIFVIFMKKNPIDVYLSMFKGAFGSPYSIRETIKLAIPLCIAALGVAVAFKMQFWNIGAEGQIMMGAFAASLLALKFSGQDLNGLDVTNVLNSVCAEETPGWQGFFRLRSTS